MSGRNKDGVRMRGWFRVLFLRPCEDACGRGLSIGIRGKYDMGNEVKLHLMYLHSCIYTSDC